MDYSSNMSGLLIHIGMPKCASTTLQQNIFSKLDGLEYIASKAKAGKTGVEDIDAFIKLSHELDFNDPDDTLVLNNAASPLKKRASKALQEGCLPLFSDESLVRRIPAKAMNNLFPGAKVLVVIRNPLRYYESAYCQYLRGYGKKFRDVMSIEKWVDSTVGCPDEYQRVVDYIEIFGTRCSILPFELLVDDRTLFAQKLSDMLKNPSIVVDSLLAEKPKNERLTNIGMFRLSVQANLQKKFPGLAQIVFSDTLKNTRSNIKNILKLFARERKIEIDLPNAMADRIARETAPMCQLFAQKSGMDLKKYGYPL